MKSKTARKYLMDMWWGAGWGLLGGVVYLGIAAGVVFFVKGGLDAAPVRPELLLAIYPAGGTAAGVIAGLFRPLLKTRVGAMFTGILAVIPIAFAFGVLQQGHWSAWSSDVWVGLGLSCTLLGVMGGYILWGQLHDLDVE